MQQSTSTNRDLTMNTSGTTQENIKHNSGEYSCRLCNKTFAYKKNYDDHYIMHDVEQICGTGMALSVQSEASPAKKQKIHACDQCDKAYHRKDHLTRHKLEHTGERPHICIVCLKSFVRKDKLTRHEKIHYKDSRVQFNCPDCNRKFLRKDSMEKHRKTHGQTGMPSENVKNKSKCTCAANSATVDNSESVKEGTAMSAKSGEVKSGNEGSGVNIQSSIYSASTSSTDTSSVSKSEGHNGNNGNSLHNAGAFKNDAQIEATIKREIDHSTATTDSTLKHPRCGGSVENMPVSQPRGYWFDPRQGHGHPHFFNHSPGFSQEMDLRVNYQCQINCGTGKNSNDNGWSK